MPSFQIPVSPKRRAAGRFISKVRRAVQKMYVEEQKARGLKQTDIAAALGVHRSVVNRILRGRENLTAGRIGELAWAMGRVAEIQFPKPAVVAGANVVPAVVPPVKVEASNASATVAPPVEMFAHAKAA